MIVDKIENPVIYLFRQSTLETIILRDVNKTRGLFWEFKGKYVEIGGSFDTLESEALRDCPNLIEAKIPDTVIYYEDSSVRNVKNLTKLNISPYVKVFRANSISNTGLELPEVLYDVETIEDYAFGYNCKIVNLTFGDKLTYFGGVNLYVHNGEVSTVLTFTSLTPPTIGQRAWELGQRPLTIRVPAESIELYKEAFSTVAHLIVPIE